MHQVLIVDDEMPVVEGLVEVVDWGALGIDAVFTAADGYEALELLDKHAIDIVITDIRMPGLSGLELIRRIKATRSNTACIVLSGYAEFDYAKQAVASQAVDYIVKPVDFRELEEAVRKAVSAVDSRWMEISSYTKASRTLKENLVLLREKLAFDLIRGIKYTDDELKNKLEELELPYDLGGNYSLLLVRLEEEFSTENIQDRSLYEYAVINIVSEILGAQFKLWHCKDEHDYLVFLLCADSPLHQTQLINQLGPEIQHCVRTYLKGRVSLILSAEDAFPQRISETYQSLVSTLLQTVGHDRDCFIPPGPIKAADTGALRSLYEPPSLLHMLEAGRWDDARAKLAGIFDELQADWSHSQEHLLEAYFMIAQSFLHLLHKSDKTLSDVAPGHTLTGALHLKPFASALELNRWAFGTLALIQEDSDLKLQNGRTQLVKKIREYIDDHLSEGISLQDLAEHIYLHPSYAAKIYRQETGESVTDYLFRIRMERAVYLLNHSNEKVQDIAAELGYLNTAYFIKVFKEHFRLTPHEFRNK